MFKKEAEEFKKQIQQEYLDLGKNGAYPPLWERIGELWEKGAEFGYNKAKEEDKWHYPSKDELPKCDEETQLIFYVNCYFEVGGKTLIRKRTVLGFYKKSFLNDDVKLFVERSKGYEEEHLSKDVIAWKEIVLPELKESE